MVSSTLNRRKRPLLPFAALALLCATTCANAQEKSQFQIVQIGYKTLYVPKVWMETGGVSVTLRHGSIHRPNFTAIRGLSVTFYPAQRLSPLGKVMYKGLPAVEGLKLDPGKDLPEWILVDVFPKGPPTNFLPMSGVERAQFEKAQSLPADEYGFVVALQSSSIAWDDRPHNQEFMLKDYLDEIGRPLYFYVHNFNYGFGNQSSAEVFARHRGQAMRYHFDAIKFPEKDWLVLHQRVLMFLDYLGAPK